LGVTFLNWLNFGYKCLPDIETLKPVKTALVLNVGQLLLTSGVGINLRLAIFCIVTWNSGNDDNSVRLVNKSFIVCVRLGAVAADCLCGNGSTSAGINQSLNFDGILKKVNLNVFEMKETIRTFTVYFRGESHLVY
jgi:hypothetical protein